MQYQGGKSRIAAGIVKTIQSVTTAREIYEPFCGGGAVTIALAKTGFRVYASDSHEDLILMWQALMRGETEPFADVTEVEYQQAYKDVQEVRAGRKQDVQQSARRGFLGFGASFGGRWFEGFGRCTDRPVQPYQESARFCQRLVGMPITFTLADYTSTPDHAVAYCDPPYKGAKPYKGQKRPFDHDAFWSWVSRRQGATFISELTCPLDLPVVWRKQHKSQNASNSPTSKGAAIIEREEKLFYKAPRDA